MIGEALGQFRITAMIGAGGMGVVYRARDERLDRDVAIKVLPPGTFADEAARKRLRLEATTLSRLNHPNIATVHDFNSQEGVDFLVMEMIPGATLDQRIMGDPLPERDLLRLGTQLAQGLAAAHAEGIVHRDLKPGNVRVTPDGRLKILDFGLAMLRKTDCDERADTAAIGDSMVAGSPPYMAPEQLLGEPVDSRTDIYAAGAVLFEMATGRRPFADAHGARLIDSILHQPPPSPSALNPRLSPGLEQIVLKCLDKEPQRRYQTARELLVDLERLSVPSAITQPAARAARSQLGWTALAGVAVVSVLAGAHAGGTRSPIADAPVPPGPIRSIAVLPLANLSGDETQEFFADGMTDALIADLGRTASVRVISRTSSMQYKQVRKPLPVIARELGVEAVVEGSVVRAGERVRINAQLVDASSDRRLWGDSYDRDVRDVIGLQAEVAAAIAREVNANLQLPERASAARVDPQAHEAYLRGRHFFQQADERSFRRALTYFEQAVGRDGSHALAYAGIADTRLVLAYMSADEFRTPPAQTFTLVEAAATRALAIDPGLAEAHCALAFANLELKWDWAAAERGFRRALQLNPSLSECHEQYAWYLAAQGRLEEALAEMNRAHELDPLSLLVNTGVGGILMYKRQTDEAIAQNRRTLELKPDFVVAHYGLGQMYMQAGRAQDAIDSFRTALSLSGESPRILADLGHAYARAGRRQEALRALARWRKATAGAFTREEQEAHVRAALGEREQAFALLEKAYQHHSPGMVWLKVDPRFDSLRDDARFQRLLHKMGLV
jgi:TolB-like protein/Tfp pilus assembly protein PilF/tRNA A-37 threonylcarbamoyl transferase component Bud32